MRLHSVASGLHGWLSSGEKSLTPKGVSYNRVYCRVYSRVARSRSNSQSYAKSQIPPNRGRGGGWGGRPLLQGIVRKVEPGFDPKNPGGGWNFQKGGFLWRGFFGLL